MFLSLKKIKSIVIRAVLGTAFIVGMVFYGTEVHASDYELTLKPRLEYGKSLVLRKQAKFKFLDVPLQPFVADEIYIEIDDGFGFKRNRALFGITPYENLTTFYMLEVDFGELTEYKNIVGLDYKLVF